ncbi:hypothetical protein BGW38_000365 [Lunasporangiospora selenospora]|uniref:Methyltransferase domain-containing protein n=1 Tax=Lunasporangiospora selenospora TaxID=979761 RepID=A0A9P6KF21_9FUNG|nr:hypothetical protein BGW38_000365 [Lunasporangiospora selenospora]
MNHSSRIPPSNNRNEMPPLTSSTVHGLEAFLPPGFHSLEDYLAQLQSFLKDCEALSNLMIVDYFTTNSWDTRLPQDWREAFESEQGRLSSLDLMELVSLGKLRDFNTTSACSTSLSEAVSVPPASSASCRSRSTATAHSPRSPTSSSRIDDQSRPQKEHSATTPKDWPQSLKDFVRMVKSLSINRTLDPDYAQFKDTLDIHLIPGMSPKKIHEVEILSGLIASYAQAHRIGSVIDLGAGQGYLSRVLAFQHKLCVLGVDSDTIQTCGAQTTQKRTEKLFVNKSKLKKRDQNGNTKRRNNAMSSLTSSSATPAAPTEVTPTKASPVTATEKTQQQGILSPVASSSALTSLPEMAPETMDVDSPSPLKPTKKSRTTRSRSSSPVVDSQELGSSNSINSPKGNGIGKKTSRSRKSKPKKEDPTQIMTDCSSSSDSGNSNIPSTGSVITDSATTKIIQSQELISPSLAVLAPATTEADPVVTSTSLPSSSAQSTSPSISKRQQGISESTTATDPKLAATPGSNFQLQHITHHITAATLPTLLKEHFPRKTKPLTGSDLATSGSNISNEPTTPPVLQDDYSEGDEEKWTLCGLHACGDLTSNMVKLFLESSATCLFSVGCCYHWITERYDKDGNIAISDEHAKMIACQSPERWLRYQKETEDAIHGHYFRALLHKLMVERGLYPGPPTVAPVLGRMGKHRLKGFPHYLATAVQRLKLPADVIKSEEAQAAYEQFLERDLYRIGILWALRTMLGPLYEGMILLDRATFLHENVVQGQGKECQGTKGGSVQLVAGFDVVESPRNMILIALKNLDK